MYLKLKQHQFFFILIWRFSKVFQKFKRAPMLHFRYLFTEIKTQTPSLILFFSSRKQNFFLKDDKHASHKDFLFIAVEKERQVFYFCQQNEKS